MLVQYFQPLSMLIYMEHLNNGQSSLGPYGIELHLQKIGNPLQVATIIASMPWVYIKDVALGG